MNKAIMTAMVALVVASVTMAADLTDVSSYAAPKLVAEINTAIGEADTRLDALEGGSTVGEVLPGYIIVGSATSNGVDVAVSGDVTMAANGAVTIAANAVEEPMLKAVDAAADEDFLSYESTTGDFEWHSVTEVAAKLGATGTLSTNVFIDAAYTNTVVLRTLATGVIVVDSWTKVAVGE